MHSERKCDVIFFKPGEQMKMMYFSVMTGKFRKRNSKCSECTREKKTRKQTISTLLVRPENNMV